MALDRDGLANAAAAFEAARAGADDSGADERGDATGHVHDARTRKVDLATQERRVVALVAVEGRCPAVAVPHPVHDHGVDEAGDHGGVDQIRTQLSALGDGARDDGRGGGGEDVLEEPEREVASRGVLHPPLLGDGDPAGGKETLGLVRAADELVAGLARLVLRTCGEGAGSNDRVRGLMSGAGCVVRAASPPLRSPTPTTR